jgi:hypothetical protein
VPKFVELVQPYFSMGEHERYLKDERVEDSVAPVYFAKGWRQ